MRISSRPRAALLLIVLVAVGALGVTLYAFRGRLATAPFIGSVFGRAQVGAPAAGAAQPPAPAPAGADGAAPAPDASEARAEITIDPKRQQLIGVRTVPVERTSVSPTIRGFGLVRYDETRLADVNLKLEGWIRDLYVDYTGHYVRKGQPLFTLYSRELLSTQNEYLLALKTRDQLKQSQIPDARESSERLVELARQRLELWDLPPDQFAKLEQTRKPQTAMAFRSPVNGSVIEKQALQGMHVMPGQTLYKIADLSVVWVEADIYEQEVPFVRVGQPAIVTLDAYQGEQFHGRVIYIYPYVEEKTRTVKARLEFANRDGRLKPGMYANVELRGPAGTGLTVPVDAVLDSGKQQIVFVAAGRRVLRAASRHDRSPPGRHGRNPQGLERRGRGRDGSHVLPRLREPASRGAPGLRSGAGRGAGRRRGTGAPGHPLPIATRSPADRRQRLRGDGEGPVGSAGCRCGRLHHLLHGGHALHEHAGDAE